MIRRSLVAFASVCLLATVGCGFVRLDLALQALRPGAVSRIFDVPVASLMMTAMEVTGIEFDFSGDEPYDFDYRVKSKSELNSQRVTSQAG